MIFSSNMKQNVGMVLPAFCLFLFILLSGCKSSQTYKPYSPHENLLSITAEFSLVAARDPYRDETGRDLMRQSIARSTLLRLSNYEAMHPGRLTPQVLAWKGRAEELLGDYSSAVRNFQEAAEYDDEISTECQRRADFLEQILAVPTTAPNNAGIDVVLEYLLTQGAEYRALADLMTDPFFQSLSLKESEDADVARIELLIGNRYNFPNGDLQALRALEQLVQIHQESRRGMSHALRLARFHRLLAEEEVRLHPPEELDFSFTKFKEHYDKALDLFYRISKTDGHRERLIAKHELDALLEYGQWIQLRTK
jgi:tetratricopeptide (TPR) repeat protein